MKRTLTILLALVLSLSVVVLAACGCQHYYENGLCKYCGELDANYDPNNLPCIHYYEHGACKYCAEVDANYSPSVDNCQHYYESGACKYCGDVDANYLPPAPPSQGGDKQATSLRVANAYGKDGQSYNLAGTVFAVDSVGYYINDGTAAMYVKDSTVVNTGDVVYLTATLSVTSSTNKVIAVSTQTEVIATGSKTVQPTNVTVVDLAKLPMFATNYYQYLDLVGFVTLNEVIYSLELEVKYVEITDDSHSFFADYVGQKVTATVVVVDYTTCWVATTVTSQPVAVMPADLDVVADSIFAWAQTQLPTQTFSNFQVPTSYSLEPTVSFAWSVSGVSGVEMEGADVVAINGVTEEISIPLTLTLSCDGKTATYTYEVKVNADFIFDWAQEQLPTTMPLSYNLPTSYKDEGNVKFDWSVEQGNAIEIASNVATVVVANATSATTVKARLTITAGDNQMSKVFDLNVPANGVTQYDQIATLPVGTTAKIVGTIIAKGYDNGTAGTTREYGITILSESKQLFTATCKDKTQWQGYTIGDTVEITGGVFKRYDAYTGKTVYRMSLSCDDVTVVTPAPANFKVDLTGVNVVTLETLEDYQALVANFQDKTGNTIVKIVNPYMTSSSASAAGNFIRFGPDTTAKNGYSTTVNGKTYKREFTLFRALYQEIDKTSYDKYTVPYNGKGCTQNMVEIYAVIMFMGDTSWQFVPLGADFTTFAQA